MAIFFFFVYHMALFTFHVIHVKWTNIIQIPDMKLHVMVFSLFEKEIIPSYNETNYNVKSRKSYWKLNSVLQNVEFWNVKRFDH